MTIVLLCLAGAAAGPGAAAAMPARTEPALIPQPASLTLATGSFGVDASTPVRAPAARAQGAAEQFVALVRAAHGLQLELQAGTATGRGGIDFVLDPDATRIAAEGYTLDVDPARIRVTARDPRGLYYGAVTLWQLLQPGADGKLAVPALRIEDAPRFAWRGLMLDSARHFQSVDEIKRLLDAMALLKLNTFHWHLTDDQGWRIQIKRYPRLAEVGGCRIPAGDAGTDPGSGQPRPYCGYYTQAQIRDVVRHAAARHITIVPELDMPGHAQAAIAAYPELGVLGDRPAVSNEWGINPYLYNVEEATIRFLENVLAEVIELFPGTYIHVGGDEAVKGQWRESARVQQRMRELGVEDEVQLQAWFIGRMHRFLAAHGRRLIGWDEILDGEMPADATVMSWRGTAGGIEAARKGHDVVMAPASDLYLDYLQTTSPDEPTGRPATIPLAQVYAFEPVPPELAPNERHHIIGLQANTWTEHMRGYDRVQHAVFPRIAALAETAWTPAARKDYPDFLDRLPAQLLRDRALGIADAQTPFEVAFEVDDDRTAGTATVALSNALGYPDIRYTLDGSEPGAASPRYEQPLQLRLPAQVRAAVYVDGRALAATSSRKLDAATQLRRSDEQLRMCTGALMLRLEDDGPADGPRAIYNVDIFNPCWQWDAADLSGIGAIRVRAGRIPYYFQLAQDEPHRRFKPATAAHGELQVRAGCEGELLAQVPLPADPGRDGFVVLDAPLAPQRGKHDLCIYFTGDTRPTMWVLDQVELVPTAAAEAAD